MWFTALHPPKNDTEDINKKFKDIQYVHQKDAKIKLIFFKKDIDHDFSKHYLPLSLASSTSRISFNNSLGDRLIMLCTVLSRVDQASLWNTMTTLVSGSSEFDGYTFLLHLDKRKLYTYSDQ